MLKKKLTSSTIDKVGELAGSKLKNIKENKLLIALFV